MMSQEIDAAETVRRLDHDNSRKLGIRHLEGNSRPLLHDLLSFLHGLSGEVHEFDVLILMIHDVLIIVAFFIFRETDPHPFTPLIGFVDGLFQYVPVDLDLDGQAGTDVQHGRGRAVRQIEKMKSLCYSQRVYFVSLSCPHHFMTPPKNESMAFSYPSVSL